MLLLVSGEGPSDIGSVGHGEDGTFFQHGPYICFWISFLRRITNIHF